MQATLHRQLLHQGLGLDFELPARRLWFPVRPANAWSLRACPPPTHLLPSLVNPLLVTGLAPAPAVCPQPSRWIPLHWRKQRRFLAPCRFSMDRPCISSADVVLLRLLQRLLSTGHLSSKIMLFLNASVVITTVTCTIQTPRRFQMLLRSEVLVVWPWQL